MNKRAEREIQHGKLWAKGDTELIWGWASPAGRIRAKRRAGLIKIGACLGPESRVLEIGCGTGVFTEIFARTGCSIVAVDISPDLLKKAQTRDVPKDKVQFMQKRFEDCAVDGPFDAVIGSSVLHHLELKDALPKIYQILKPDGIMSFAEPNMLNPQVFAERKCRSLFPIVSPDETAFVRWTFRKDLQKAGFRDVKIVPFDWLHPAVPKPLIGLVSVLGKGLERIPLLREFSGSLYIQAVR